MDFDELKSPELQERLKGVKTPEGPLALAKEQGYGLSDGQLEDVAGGKWANCPDYHKTTQVP